MRKTDVRGPGGEGREGGEGGGGAEGEETAWASLGDSQREGGIKREMEEGSERLIESGESVGWASEGGEREREGEKEGK